MSEVFDFDGRVWRRSEPVMDKDGNEGLEWVEVPITEVPQKELLETYEDLVLELSDKEVELSKVKEEYNRKEFDIVFKSTDIDFKGLYGSASEKTRRQHAKEVLSELDGKKSDLKLSVAFIQNYIPLLREVLRSKSD